MAFSVIFKATLVVSIVVLSWSNAEGSTVAEMQAKWEAISDGIDQINTEARAAGRASGSLEPEVKPVAKPGAPPLTPTLVAWISSQSEGMVEEMEAIANHNAQSSTFSVVNYLRYLKLYDSLKVVARQPLEEFRWVNRKAKVFAKVYAAASEVVYNYLLDLDSSLSKIEAAEPKGKSKEVSKEWVELYESIRYIATHASVGSNLAQTATQMLQKSPNNTSDKVRSTRYQLKTHAFNRR